MFALENNMIDRFCILNILKYIWEIRRKALIQTGMESVFSLELFPGALFYLSTCLDLEHLTDTADVHFTLSIVDQRDFVCFFFVRLEINWSYLNYDVGEVTFYCHLLGSLPRVQTPFYPSSLLIIIITSDSAFMVGI